MFALFFSIICAWFAFFLPTFATYKVLSQRPIPEPELERWTMYWSVIGCLVGIEYVAEWLVSWIPFYWEVKTVFLLFLSLPQTQGSTFVYNSYLKPWFSKNEASLDSGIMSIQASALNFIKVRLTMLWELVWGVLNKTPATGQPPAAGSTQGGAPALNLQSVMGLWQTYGPGLVSAFGAKAAPAQAQSASTPAPASASSSSVDLPAAGVYRVPTPQAGTPLPEAVAPSFPEPQHS